jgi:exodeoxyribonuclease V alpha subunit
VETRAVPIVELTEVHRQAAATGIPQASIALRAGIVPELKDYAGRGAGISFIDCARPAITTKLVELVNELGGFDEVQILSPVKNVVAGTRDINSFFHSLHLGCVGLQYEGFSVGEPVIWTQNDYDLDLMNGSLGKVVRAAGSLAVDWDGDEKIIDNPSHMEHAYAITIHKSQGSQFRRVIIPLYECKLLDRTMLYTAITRAQEQVTLIGDREAFETSVLAPPSTSLRKTGMCFALEKAKAQQLAAAESGAFHPGPETSA